MDATSSFENARKILRAYVDIAYSFPLLCFGDAWFPQERILHIIKRRKADGRTADEVKQLFDQIPDTAAYFDFELPNRNQKDYPGSVMRIRDGFVVVVNKPDGLKGEIITAFIRNPAGIKALKKKKFQESASGETPRLDERSSH